MPEEALKRTALVSATVIDVARIPGRGRLLATATMEICIEGVELQLAGVRLVRGDERAITVEPPKTRDYLGRPTLCVELPSAVMEAIEAALMKELDDQLEQWLST